MLSYSNPPEIGFTERWCNGCNTITIGVIIESERDMLGQKNINNKFNKHTMGKKID